MSSKAGSATSAQPGQVTREVPHAAKSERPKLSPAVVSRVPLSLIARKATSACQPASPLFRGAFSGLLLLSACAASTGVLSSCFLSLRSHLLCVIAFARFRAAVFLVLALGLRQRVRPAQSPPARPTPRDRTRRPLGSFWVARSQTACYAPLSNSLSFLIVPSGRSTYSYDAAPGWGIIVVSAEGA